MCISFHNIDKKVVEATPRLTMCRATQKKPLYKEKLLILKEVCALASKEAAS